MKSSKFDIKEINISFCAGCFDGDYLHDGHKYLINKMVEASNYQVIALNSDDYIRRHKRDPICHQDERKNRLLKLGLDEVVIFDEDSPIQIIKTIEPHSIFVGDDYTLDRVVGYPECKEWGGEVQIIDRINDISTTNIINETNLP
jgi:D-beta-D-heptose 7-phosphate kinase/D-beta-D-heptose 1-phosphate adenosyltransferase|tara:strand:- start:1248 stop:1682 length:435 start_codon:yes stop_codon:yes gene_type:complete